MNKYHYPVNHPMYNNDLAYTSFFMVVMEFECMSKIWRLWHDLLRGLNE